jgi:hypothetical protein
MPNTPKLPEELVLEAYIEGLKDGRSDGGNRHIRIKDLRKGLKATHDVEQLKIMAGKLVAQELATLKAQVRKEIEELKYNSARGETSFHEFCYDQALNEALSIDSLKEASNE